MLQNEHKMSFFRRQYDKVKRHIASRNQEKKLAQEYKEIMRRKNSVFPA